MGKVALAPSANCGRPMFRVLSGESRGIDADGVTLADPTFARRGFDPERYEVFAALLAVKITARYRANRVVGFTARILAKQPDAPGRDILRSLTAEVRKHSKYMSAVSASQDVGHRPALRVVANGESRPAGRPAAQRSTSGSGAGGDEPGGSDPSHLTLPAAPCWVEQAVRHITATEPAEGLTFARLRFLLAEWPPSWQLAVWNALPDAWFHSPSSNRRAVCDSSPDRTLGGAA